MPSFPALTRSVELAFGHHDAPLGDALRVDARSLGNPPEGPDIREGMLRANGLAPAVRAYVLATPGADRIIERSLTRVSALLALPGHLRVDIHVLCGGGPEKDQRTYRTPRPNTPRTRSQG